MGAWGGTACGADAAGWGYGEGVGVAPDVQAPALTQPLREGDEGEAIKAVQERLKALGYYHGTIDGVFSPALAEAVLAFQQGNHLLETGMVDEITCRVMFSDEASAADADTASDAKLRAAILAGEAVPPDSVRIEEMLNYFHYNAGHNQS